MMKFCEALRKIAQVDSAPQLFRVRGDSNGNGHWWLWGCKFNVTGHTRKRVIIGAAKQIRHNEHMPFESKKV
jgi:hypothetical protein